MSVGLETKRMVDEETFGSQELLKCQTNLDEVGASVEMSDRFG